MTRKHYELFAAAIAQIEDKNARREHAALIADVCAADNERFDRGRFMYACGVHS